MKVENPVFEEARQIFERGDVVEHGRPVQYPDVLIRFTVLAVLVVVGAAAGWTVLFHLLDGLDSVLFFALVLGLVGVAWLTIRAFRKGNTGLGVVLAVAYALAEGAFIGFISRLYNDIFADGIVGQAVLATAVTVAVVVGYSASPWGKRTGRATKVFAIAIISYLIFSLISIGLGMFLGVGGGWGIWGMGVVGIIACLVGVVFASWSINVDIVTLTDIVESGQPMPKGTYWLLAFGIAVSILWLYLEILRLLGRSKR